MHRPAQADDESRFGAAMGWIIPLLAIVANAPALFGTFIWDDDLYLTANRLVHAADGIRRMWLTTDALDYYPLSSTTLWLEWRVWGMHAMGYHATNLLIHAVTCALLYRVLRKLAIPGAWLAAALFAVHPACTEAVAWISQRKTLLAACLAMASLYSALGTSRRAYAGSVLLFALALLSKTSVVMMPCALLVLAWWQRGRVTRSDVLRTGPYFLVALVLGLVTLWFQTSHAIAGDMSVRPEGLLSRVAGTGWSFWFFLYKAFFPVFLATVYPRWTIDTDEALAFAPLAAALLFFILLVRLQRNFGRGPLAAMLVYGLMLAPFLGLLDIGFMMYSLVADHWQYPAIAAALTLPAAALYRWSSSVRTARTMGLALVLVFAIGSMQRAWIMRDEFNMWLHNIAIYPNVWMGHVAMGDVFMSRGLIQEAELQYQAAVTIRADLATAHANLGLIALQRGDVADGLARLGQAVDLYPTHPETRYFFGCALLKNGRAKEAVHHLYRAVHLRPDNPLFQNQFAWTLATHTNDAIRDAQLAMKAATEACRLTGRRDYRTLSTLAAALAESGDFDAAAETQEEAIRLAEAAGLARVVPTLQERVSLYRSGKPFRSDSF